MIYRVNDIVGEFQSRRSLTWQKTRRWVLFTAIAFPTAILVSVGVSFAKVDLGLHVMIIIAFMFAVGTGIIAINLLLSRYYLCPACERIPYRCGNVGGVFIDPDTCPHYRAVLK